MPRYPGPQCRGFSDAASYPSRPHRRFDRTRAGIGPKTAISGREHDVNYVWTTSYVISRIAIDVSHYHTMTYKMSARPAAVTRRPSLVTNLYLGETDDCYRF